MRVHTSLLWRAVPVRSVADKNFCRKRCSLADREPSHADVHALPWHPLFSTDPLSALTIRLTAPPAPLYRAGTATAALTLRGVSTEKRSSCIPLWAAESTLFHAALTTLGGALWAGVAMEVRCDAAGAAGVALSAGAWADVGTALLNVWYNGTMIDKAPVPVIVDAGPWELVCAIESGPLPRALVKRLRAACDANYVVMLNALPRACGVQGGAGEGGGRGCQPHGKMRGEVEEGDLWSNVKHSNTQ